MPCSPRYCVPLALLALIVGGAIWKWGVSEPSSGSGTPQKVASVERANILRSPPAAEPALPSSTARPWFVTREGTGIDFQHDSGTSPEKPFPAANGSGIAAVDFDLDGQSDLYFLTGTPFPVDSSRRSPINRLFRNRGGWRFDEVTQPSGLGHNGYSAGVTCGDYNGDGFPDIYVACYGADVLYRNLGDGTFLPLEASSGIGDERWATSAAMLDYDDDGLLDIYICNYGRWTLETNDWCGEKERNLRHYCSPRSIPPERDTLLRNAGDDTFVDVTEEAGVATPLARAQGVIAAHLDDNGAIDLYVGNDLNANSLFLNEGHGRFRNASESSGAAYDYLGSMQAGMGVDAEDTDGDGRAELIVTNFAGEHNTFYYNGGDGAFQDMSQQRGLYAASLPWVGWGTVFADFNLDGWSDLVVTNGHVDDNRPGIPYTAPPLLWSNERGRFTFVGDEAGDFFTRHHVGRALALADLDHDGDQDLAIGHQDGPPALLENTYRSQTGGPPSVSLRLIGTQSNRDAVGSILTLRSGDYVRVLQVKGGGSYLSAHDLARVFALPSENIPYQLEIRWPDGTRSVLDDLSQPGKYIIVQPDTPGALPRVTLQESWP